MSDALLEVAKKHRMSFSPCENVHVRSQLRASETYVHATASYCDCGSPLFWSKTRPAATIARQVAKLRKKKWSEAKIEKWLEATRPRPDDPNAPPGGVRSVNEWASFFDAALRLRGVPYIGIIGHWYHGDLTDAFSLDGRTSHTVAELRDGGFGTLAQDVIHEFRLENLG